MSLRRLRLVAPTGYTFRASWESMCILGARGGEPGSTAATWTLTQMRRGAEVSHTIKFAWCEGHSIGKKLLLLG